jgi:hypothetical protein
MRANFTSCLRTSPRPSGWLPLCAPTHTLNLPARKTSKLAISLGADACATHSVAQYPLMGLPAQPGEFTITEVIGPGKVATLIRERAGDFYW